MIFSLALAASNSGERRHYRSLAWFPEPWVIGGKEVRVMTLADYRTLSMVGSDVIFGGDFSEEAVAQFLWFLSPEFLPDPELREVFIREVYEQLCEVREELEEYLDFIFLDAPPSSSGGKRIAVSYMASIIHTLATAYGWRPSEILALPVPQAFQLLKLIRVYNNPDAPDFDGGEALRSVFLQYLNSLPLEQRAEIKARVNAGEEIEIPDEWLHQQS